MPQNSKIRAHEIIGWAQLMARVFTPDVLECPRCTRMRILAAIEYAVVARKILDSGDLSSRPPPVAPAPRNPHARLTEL